ncbi:hypothetical protein O181_004237 [Austropuccinia psidii MF-1]|uniref:Uncharacterized protein n=1 Tax=Austropuccinia psidii MF-1 TaxID=1389203 RepID=A0A9Q3BGD7_9BASI|nr:hypothetical protein [Austropuccinia psidii MF-1]
MEEETPFRRGCMDSKRSKLFSGLLDGYPEISQGPISRLSETEDKEGEESNKTKLEASLEGVPKAFEAPNLILANQPLVSQAEPNFLRIMEQMTQFMGQLTQAVSPSFKTPPMKAPDSFFCTQAHKF